MDRSLTRFYESSCKGKTAYSNPAAALTACVTMRRQRRENVWAYRCHFEPHYHTGHSHPLIRAFIRDLMIPKETIRLTYTLADSLSGATIKKLLPRA
jgi:hypothetical protein